MQSVSVKELEMAERIVNVMTNQLKTVLYSPRGIPETIPKI